MWDAMNISSSSSGYCISSCYTDMVTKLVIFCGRHKCMTPWYINLNEIESEPLTQKMHSFFLKKAGFSASDGTGGNILF